jgi:hypothetical protein
MKTRDELNVTNQHGTTTTISPTTQTCFSFTQQLLRKDLEEEINGQKLMSPKVAITASGENVALVLDYETKNPTKIANLVLISPRINISDGTNPIDYYWGNFPLSAIDKSKLKGLSITINYGNLTNDNNDNDVKAIIELCRQGKANIAIPHYLTEWYNQMTHNICFPQSNASKQDPNAELNAIIYRERISWLSNKVLLITIAGLFYLLSKKL